MFHKNKKSSDNSSFEHAKFMSKFTFVMLCVISFNLIITKNISAEPCNFSITISKTDVACYGESSGFAEVLITGPLGNYNILWTNGDTTNVARNLSAKTYFVKVNDTSGCEIIDFIEINQPDPIVVNPVVTPVKCFGENTGSIQLNATGGKGNYTYLWSNGSEESNVDELYAGSYWLNITDANFCLLTDTFNITESSEITESHIVKSVSGYGLSNGAISVDVWGGEKPYRYEWRNDDSALIDTIEDISNLISGTYILKLTDDYSCILNTIIYVDQPDTLQATLIVQNVDCAKGKSGAIDMTVTGGVQPYQYIWSNSKLVLETSDEDLFQLVEDTYFITIIDDKGNVFSDSAIVYEPTPILVNFYIKDVTCHGGIDGIALITVSGGTPEYAFQWSNGAETADLLDVSAGDYQVNIVDKNGCSFDGNVSIDQPLPYEIEQNVSGITCKDASDGSISLTVSGNTPPYTYMWSNDSQDFAIDSLEANVYLSTIYDSNQCDTTLFFTMVNPDIGCIYIPNAFTPNADGFNDVWIIENSWLYPNIEIVVYSLAGYIVYNAGIDDPPWDGTYNGGSVSSGTYYYTINTNNGDPYYKGTVTIVR